MKKINDTAISGSGASVYNISVTILTELTDNENIWVNDISELADSLSLSDPTAHEKYKYV